MTEQEEKKTQEACAAEKEETPAGECGCDTETCAEEPKEEKKALSVEELQTALQLAEAKVLEHYDLYANVSEEEFQDERGTTITAHNYLNATNTRGKKRKAVVDAVAAVVILQNYLDRAGQCPEPIRGKADSE